MVPKSASSLTAKQMARYIDHTMLEPQAGPAAFDRLCEEAVRHGFKAVCVNSGWVAYVTRRLLETPIAICSVIGFPLGAVCGRTKAFEACKAVKEGAGELDMVLNVGLLKSGDHRALKEDILAVRRKAEHPVLLKVIIETCLLTDDEKIRACVTAKEAGADYVKTSTGFSTGGATVADVALMRKTVGPDMGVKASGGIRDFKTAAAMIDAGATRIGAGAGVDIVSGAGE